MAVFAHIAGDLDRARALAEESLFTSDRLDNKRNRATAVGTLASITLAEGDFEAGLALLSAPQRLPERPGSIGGRPP